MSFLVKGMEMPKRCFECPIIDATYGFWCSAADKDFRKEHGINLSKPDWCPLRPLPETHGRLIDADAIIEDIRKNSESYFADDFAHEWIDRQPTIVEAEGE